MLRFLLLITALFVAAPVAAQAARTSSDALADARAAIAVEDWVSAEAALERAGLETGGDASSEHALFLAWLALAEARRVADPALAERAYRAALALEPSSTLAHHGLALVLEAQHDHAGALAEYAAMRARPAAVAAAAVTVAPTDSIAAHRRAAAPGDGPTVGGIVLALGGGFAMLGGGWLALGHSTAADPGMRLVGWITAGVGLAALVVGVILVALQPGRQHAASTALRIVPAGDGALMTLVGVF